MTEQKPIDFNTDYVRKVQSGILIPKKAHENFETIKKEIKEIKDIVNQVLANFKK
jgi:methyltransferase-like protein